MLIIPMVSCLADVFFIFFLYLVLYLYTFSLTFFIHDLKLAPEVRGHLDGDGHQLVVRVQVKQDERRRQVILLPVDGVGGESVEQPVIHHEHVSSLPTVRRHFGSNTVNQVFVGC